MLNILKITISIIILTLILIFDTFIYAKNFNPKAIIIKEMDYLQKHYSIGTSSYFLDTQAFKNYGFANCTQFAKLLKERLHKRGYNSRVVGVVFNLSGGHNFLEINIGNKWIVADPMTNVLYENSLIELLINPSLAKQSTRPKQMQNALEVLTVPDFFANVSAVDFGEFYLSDKLRWTPISPTKKYNSQYSTYNCPKSECSWNLPISPDILNDKIFATLPMVKIITLGIDTMISDENNKNFFKVNSQEFLPQIIIPNKRKLKINSSAKGPHKIIVYAAVNATDKITDVDMRTPKPSILIFRNAAVDFYESHLVCNGVEVWNKKQGSMDVDEVQEFHNAFFLSSLTKETPWSERIIHNGKIFRQSRFDLPGNEARLRMQPLLIDQHNNVQCQITFSYKAQNPVEVFLYSEGNHHLSVLGKLPICTHNICSEKFLLKKSSVSAMYMK